MSGNVRFWRNFALIGFAHVALILGLVRWGNAARPAPDQSIVWMSGGMGDAAAEANAALTSPTPEPEQEPEANKESAPPVEEDGARAMTAQSEIQLPTPEPSATPTATPRPTPPATPKPTPHPVAKAIPKPSVKPKAKPKPSAKPTPKKMLAKATPKPKPVAQEKKLETESEEPKPAEDQPEPKKPATSSLSTSAGNQGGGGKNGSGGGAASRFGWYGNMLHDRFYSEWAQPSATLTAGAKVSTLVKVRIEKDGRVSNFEIVRSSGNPVVDDSIKAMGKRVTQVDPLPEGLGTGEHYEVRINFELNAEQ